MAKRKRQYTVIVARHTGYAVECWENTVDRAVDPARFFKTTVEAGTRADAEELAEERFREEKDAREIPRAPTYVAPRLFV